MNFKEKSLHTIELPSVLQMLSDQAVTENAKEEALKLTPSADRAEVVRRLSETTAAKTMMVVRGSPTLSGVRDIRASLARADLGGTLNTRELLDIARVLQCSRLVKGYIADEKTSGTCIDYLFHALSYNRHLEEKISTSILGEEEIADGASSELANIRRKMRAASSSAREALQRIISSPTYAKALQEQIITTRSDRYVVPVKAEYKGSIPGLVHDVSSSGMTLFVEPMAAVKANNELRELAAKERQEIERILAELSADCAAERRSVDSDYSILIRLDLIFAKAKLSYKLNCTEPAISENNIVLRKARHPLLDQTKAVPISLELGRDYKTLVITGPNTGGKTVSLKTIGLLSAMNQCGLHIPAGDGSELPVFGEILADIGDEQSIEQNLSTFSAHMANIVSILAECGERSLVLFDELGAGTDPTEGAALAISIIEYVHAQGAVIAATTHYAELKVYATNEPEVQNASCEFDVETLQPTYRLLVGIPGKSNAFAISKRLGLDERIIQEAQKRIGTENRSFEATIEKLEQTRLKLENDRDEIARRLREAEENAKKAAFLRAELEVRLEKADVKAKREAERIIEDARRTADEVFSELDEMRRKKNSEDNIQQINEARSELRHRLNLAQENLHSSTSDGSEPEEVNQRPVKAGDTVKIRSMGMKAEVISVAADGTLSLRAGIMTVTARQEDVQLLDEVQKKQKKTISTGTQLRSSIASEIDLRGMDSIDAVNTAEQFIDAAVMGRLKSVVLIHGKGTGALRNAIHSMLKMNRCVKSYRLGRYGEGETGVTIVELK